MSRDELMRELERLVDGSSLSGVIDALQGVCYAKEEHVSSAWQDGPLARQWLKAARALDHCRGFTV
jgi:hypothetical protein